MTMTISYDSYQTPPTAMDSEVVPIATSVYDEEGKNLSLLEPVEVTPVETTAIVPAVPQEKQQRQSSTAVASTTSKVPSPPNKAAMKRKRKKRTVAAGVVGGTAGFLLLGPVGAVVVGVGSAAATKRVGKARERKLMRKYED